MVQVDVFWSYGLASGLAWSAREKLGASPAKPVLETREFALSMLWIGALFAASGIYLLWGFPAWETMFLARAHADIPAWLAALFAATNVTQGALGFWVTARLIRAGRPRLAAWQPIAAHAAMLFVLIVGWDGTGWKRFTYAGTGNEWHDGVVYPWEAFFGSPIFWALAGLGVILVPTYVALVLKFRRA